MNLQFPYRHLKLLAYIVAITAFGLMGCQAVHETAEVDGPAPTAPQTYFAGVDSTIAQAATALADSSFVNMGRQEQAVQLVAEGHRVVTEADSLLRVDTAFAFLSEPAGPDTTSNVAQAAAVEAFNQGARTLKGFAEADSVQAAVLLEEAQRHFEQALSLNPFDIEARFWLARVYQLRATRLGAVEEHEQALGILRRLAWMRRDEHEIVAALARAHEHLGQWDGAAALWQRAARIALDDEQLDPEGIHQTDSSLLVTYYVRSERAFVEAGDSKAALRALGKADVWAESDDDRALVKSERAWILWDDGNLETRKTWDWLLALSRRDPEAALNGMDTLAGEVTSRQAACEVGHRLGLLYHETGDPLRAARTLQALWQDFQVAQLTEEAPAFACVERVREDYGTVTYNLARSSYRDGDLRASLAYLLQSEETGFSQVGQAALEAALLLKNNTAAALEAAHRAEVHITQLELKEQKELLRYLVELYRRQGDREAAMNYVQKYRALADTP